MKICKVEGCENNCFGGGYCAYHQYIRRMRGGDLYKPRQKKNTKPIPQESKKRKKEHIRYLDQRKMFIAEWLAEGKKCFMSDMDFKRGTIDGFATIHHTRGRTGDYYLDKKYWVLARNDKHLEFTMRPVRTLLDTFWYKPIFLPRLKELDELAYNKELTRIKKAGIDLNEENLFN